MFSFLCHAKYTYCKCVPILMPSVLAEIILRFLFYIVSSLTILDLWSLSNNLEAYLGDSS